jgi:DNA-binding MarR family transcriptional regulator
MTDTITRAASWGVTQPQLDLLRAIKARIDANGYSPSLRELAVDLGVCPNDVKGKLERLRREGLVTFVDGQARTVRVVEVTA